MRSFVKLKILLDEKHDEQNDWNIDGPVLLLENFNQYISEIAAIGLMTGNNHKGQFAVNVDSEDFLNETAVEIQKRWDLIV